MICSYAEPRNRENMLIHTSASTNTANLGCDNVFAQKPCCMLVCSLVVVFVILLCFLYILDSGWKQIIRTQGQAARHLQGTLHGPRRQKDRGDLPRLSFDMLGGPAFHSCRWSSRSQRLTLFTPLSSLLSLTGCSLTCSPLDRWGVTLPCIVLRSRFIFVV